MDVPTYNTLTRLSSRLEHILLSPAAESRLRQSSYERKRVSANVDHARDLLTTLEKQSNAIRIHSQKQQAQTDLTRQRDIIKRLHARLQELDQVGADEESDDESADEPERKKDSFAPATRDTHTGINIGEAPDVVSFAPQNEVRSRRPASSSATGPTNTGAASGNSVTKQELFAGRKQHLDFETSEALMNHNTKEQEALTNGLLSLARALKESSLNFASSLESEKEIMARAEGGLDKSAQGMDAAEKKMGMLRRMSEGQGWWGRIKLYGFIAALWVACFLLVFVGPKLRL